MQYDNVNLQLFYMYIHSGDSACKVRHNLYTKVKVRYLFSSCIQSYTVHLNYYCVLTLLSQHDGSIMPGLIFAYYAQNSASMHNLLIFRLILSKHVTLISRIQDTGESSCSSQWQ